MINDILTAIQERLTSEVPALKYLAEDWGQLDYYAENPPVKFPCGLLELQQAQWQNQGQKVQDGVLNISLRVADLMTQNPSYRASAAQKLREGEIWMVLANIHKALHGWRPQTLPEFGALTRTSTRKVKRDDGIREFEVVYACLCSDADAMDELYHSAPVLEIDAKTTEAD